MSAHFKVCRLAHIWLFGVVLELFIVNETDNMSASLPIVTEHTFTFYLNQACLRKKGHFLVCILSS